MLGPAALTLACAELGARLLAPRHPLPDPVPVDLETHFSRAEIARGARYARPQMAIGLGRGALELGVLAAAARRAGRRSDGLPAGPGGGAAVAAGLGVAGTVAGLPLSALARRRSLAAGLATQSWRDWGLDLVKGGAIEAGLSGAAGALLSALIVRSPRHWWLPAAGAVVAAGAGLGALAPVLLDPVFNDFTPLPEGELRADVLALAAQAGVRVGAVFSVDASRRTTAANAYVTGLGPTKRVVLFDTLLDRYSRDEVRTVVAHELAHVAHRDVLRSLGFAALVAGPLAFATQRVAAEVAPGAPGAAQLPGLALAASLLAAPTGLSASRLSRAVERRADADAIALTRAPEAFISFERAIALQNVADIDPPVWARVLASHPSTAERIGAALAAS